MSLCLLRFDEEQRKLEKRKKRALEDLKRRKKRWSHTHGSLQLQNELPFLQ